ncbi:uncharacterized protein LOC102719188 isoform X2 [Oryza brachyantha]|uniref:uncharacterized protein LOC102719188 isoform X2 n=1 Tax=Oryza brachyantha TaxID=4533 RepID=UPI001ADB88A9|nr:uncharacterized protein LOC102719188 isoform X2 [Oryza brachyantha]
MAKVPDLGSDFAQKLLLDLRRRRERLGFDSPAPPVQRTSSSSKAAARRDAHSSSQRPLRSQKPQQAAPRVARAEAATTNKSYQQSGNAIARAGKPRHRDTPTTNSHQIVPFQGGGGGSKPATASSIDVQMALALALSNRGKLQNIELVSRNGSIFLRDQDHSSMQLHHRRGEESRLVPAAAPPHVGKVAIGVQKLNDILMAYSSRDTSRRSSADIGRELFRGAMDLEESLSMLVMLQDASDYMEGSGNGKVMLLEGKENRKNSTHSARLVEIFDEDSETDQASNARSLSMQIVPHKKSQSCSINNNSAFELSTVTGNAKNNASEVDKDDSKVRMPSVIAKLMGLENLPSTKVINKGMEKFVKPESVPRKDRRANSAGAKLPIQIIGSERVPSKGRSTNLLPGEWRIGLKNSEEFESGNVQLSNRLTLPLVNKQTRQTMRQMLSRVESTERRGSLGQAMYEDKKVTEETNQQQKVVNVGCRTDAGKKMDFLKRFRRNSGSRQVAEEKQIIQEKNTGKKQVSSMKQFLGRDSEDKYKRARDKFNKENFAITETKNAGRGKNGKTDQRKRQSYNKQTNMHRMEKDSRNYGEMNSKEGIQSLDYKKSTKSEATQLKRLPYTAEIQQENGKHGEENDIGKPSEITYGDGGISEQSNGMMKDKRTSGMVSSDQFMDQIAEELDTTPGVHPSDRSNLVDERVTQTNITDTFTEREHHQNLQLVEVKEQPMDGLSDDKDSSNLTDLQDQNTHVVSCDSFTENQLVLMKMLLKDQYLIETAKALVRNPAPVHFVNASADKWSEKFSSLFSDIAREVIRKKGKRTEAMVEVSMTHPANMKSQYLDDLLMELDGDIESLNISKKSHQQGDDHTAENLRMILHRDMQNNHPDANSMWDFGWNGMSGLPIERNEVVRDLEKNILGGMITDVARELIEFSVRHRCCACEA